MNLTLNQEIHILISETFFFLGNCMENILIVEDDTDMLSLIEDALKTYQDKFRYH